MPYGLCAGIGYGVVKVAAWIGLAKVDSWRDNGLLDALDGLDDLEGASSGEQMADGSLFGGNANRLGAAAQC